MDECHWVFLDIKKWFSVAFITDDYAQVSVGRKITSLMRTDLMLEALKTDASRRILIGGCVHRSFAGSQYDPICYIDRLADASATTSIGSVCDSYDNARSIPTTAPSKPN